MKVILEMVKQKEKEYDMVKRIYYYASGDRYEGDCRNDKREGKGIYYYANGDRQMGDYSNNKPIGKHVRLTRNWEVKIENY